MNKFMLLSMMIILPGCNWLQSDPEPLPLPPVKVITETVQLEIYQPPLPPPIQLDDIKWFVVTEQNLQEKIQEIEYITGTDFVLFGMTPQSYENMAYNFQEMRRYIRQQTEIIKYYREATRVRTPEEWLTENTRRQEQRVNTEAPTNDEQLEQPGFFRRLIGN
jgi:hypothetical protein